MRAPSAYTYLYSCIPTGLESKRERGGDERRGRRRRALLEIKKVSRDQKKKGGGGRGRRKSCEFSLRCFVFGPSRVISRRHSPPPFRLAELTAPHVDDCFFLSGYVYGKNAGGGGGGGNDRCGLCQMTFSCGFNKYVRLRL